MRGRRPKPTQLRVIEGNPGRRPLNRTEPTSPVLAGPPKGWTAGQKVLWHEVVEAAPPHVLMQADRFLVELIARLMAQLRADPVLRAGLAGQLRACLSEVGMTPSARSRLSVAPPDAVNPSEAFGADVRHDPS